MSLEKEMNRSLNKSMVKTLLLGTSVTLLAIALIVYPKEALEGSVRGLNTWWKVVFPSLLPFFIVSEMLIGFGVVKFIGILLEPFMRPLFRVPGVGGFALAMGMASGFPSGAKITSRLRQEKQLTAIEAERLVSFTNSSNPIFIFGAVAVGFFHNPAVGIILALSHYIGNICVGLVMRFYGSAKPKGQVTQKPSLSLAFHEMHKTRLKDKRPIGKLLGDAVTSAVQSLLMIGGFIILFSVLNKLLYVTHITSVLSSGLAYLFSLCHIGTELSLPFISGLFEITLGSRLASEAPDTLLFHQIIIVSFVLGFSGFSVQAQVASILAETDIRFFPFFIARIFHGCFAVVFTIFLWGPLRKSITTFQASEGALPVFSHLESVTILSQWLNVYGPLLTIFTLCCYIYIYSKRTFLHRS